ncbi:MAG TPA: cadherin domain-containing protein, partial [Rhizobiaceae bacterium]|nr:cadherin domain-containing protein [Rhizobiaceae bacterium]
ATDDRAISLPPLTGGTVSITDNLISGAHESSFGSASWGRGIWFDGGGVDLVVTGNTIEWSRTGINIDMGGSSTATIDGNTFSGTGSGVSGGVDADGVSINDNTFGNVGTDFNFRGLTSGVTFDAEAAIETLNPTGTPAQDAVIVLGGAGADTLKGTAGSDLLDGNNHATLGANNDADDLDGRGGDDALFGRGGDDTLKGGSGSDTIDGGAGTDTAVFDGDWSDYTITFDSGTGTYMVTGNGDTDTLTNVELIKFGSGAAINIADAVDVDPVLGPIGTLNVDEDTMDGTVIATAAATDANADAGFDDEVTFSLRAIGGGVFTGPFEINATTGEITLSGSLDFEAVDEYTFIVVAADNAGNEDTEEVTVNVQSVDEGIGGLDTSIDMLFEEGTTLSALDNVGTDDSLTFDVNALNLGGGGKVFLADGVTELTAAMNNLTLDQVNGLLYSSGTDGSQTTIQLVADDGLGNTELITFTLGASAPVNGAHVGTTAADRLDGAAGNDYINGKAGADTMIGGRGDDVIVIDEAGDMAVERLNEGTDEVRTFINYMLGANIENGKAIGGAGIALGGNALDNKLTGNSAANNLTGRAGDDVLDGKYGNDILNGNMDNDTFVFSTALNRTKNVDRVFGFDRLDDQIQLSSDVFSKAGADGLLAAAAFKLGASATDASDRIIYNQSTGELFYDADGNGTAAQVLFAVIANRADLRAADFEII